MKHYLYRHFSKDGTLLYAGISLSTIQRLGQHRNQAHWYDQITRVEVEQFATRKDALAAERAAIKHENPLYNIQFSLEQANARRMARAMRNETIKTKPSIIERAVELGKKFDPATFWQWRADRRAKNGGISAAD